MPPAEWAERDTGDFRGTMDYQAESTIKESDGAGSRFIAFPFGPLTEQEVRVELARGTNDRFARVRRSGVQVPGGDMRPEMARGYDSAATYFIDVVLTAEPIFDLRRSRQ